VNSAADRSLDGRRRVSARLAGASSTGSVSVRVPTGTPRGTYFLLACTDQTAAVSESSDSNNCRAAMTSVNVQ
jgi:hypothetical protein